MKTTLPTPVQCPTRLQPGWSRSIVWSLVITFPAKNLPRFNVPAVGTAYSNGPVNRAELLNQFMSALGQKQTSRSEITMSALPPKADIAQSG
jgi:hypothetical protein